MPIDKILFYISLHINEVSDSQGRDTWENMPIR